MSAEEGTEHYLPWYTREIRNLIIANLATLSHDDSDSYSFSSEGHKFGGMAPWPPLDPTLAKTAFTTARDKKN